MNSFCRCPVQVRVILERLARRCGFQAVSESIPEKDRKLLAHIRKEKQRHERKRQGASEADGVCTSCYSCPERKPEPPFRLREAATVTSKAQSTCPPCPFHIKLAAAGHFCQCFADLPVLESYATA